MLLPMKALSRAVELMLKEPEVREALWAAVRDRVRKEVKAANGNQITISPYDAGCSSKRGGTR